MNQVCVPSKGRAGKSKLLANHTGFIVFVEPQEYYLYVSHFPQHRIVDICENDMGAVYVRNFILEYMEEFKSFWVLDDDITGFFYREGTRLIKCLIEVVLTNAEVQFDILHTHLGSLEYRNLAWCAKKDFISNTSCNICVYFNDIKNIKYTDFGGFNGDKDFAIQCILNGLNVHRTTLYAFDAPPMGRGLGGGIDYSSLVMQELCCDNFVHKWGNQICEKIFKNDRFIVKVNWKALKSKQLSLLF